MLQAKSDLPMDDAYTFGSWLKQRRKQLHLTQRELAQGVGYAEVTLRKVEADELRPSVAMAQRLAAALQIPAADQAQFLRFARDEAGATPKLDPAAALAPPPPLPLDYPAPFALVTAASKLDWGEAPDISGFQGREQEVDRLCQWLAVDRCRVVAMLGMGGVGKTALATFVAAAVQAQFTAVIWRSLRNAPPLAELLRQWLQVLSPQSPRELPQDVDNQLAMLLHYLRGQRCLLVLDNFETVLQPERPGRYLPGCEGYGRLLKQLGEGRHQSCLLLTSREKPPELIPLAGERAPVRTLGGNRLAPRRRPGSHAGPQLARQRRRLGSAARPLLRQPARVADDRRNHRRTLRRRHRPVSPPGNLPVWRYRRPA